MIPREGLEVRLNPRLVTAYADTHVLTGGVTVIDSGPRLVTLSVIWSAGYRSHLSPQFDQHLGHSIHGRIRPDEYQERVPLLF